MQVPTIFAILSFALAAVAIPCKNEARDEPTVGANGNAICGNGQVISCCNKKSVSSASGVIAVGGALDDVLGGDCNPLTVPVLLGITIPISQACAGNQAACCTGNESGLLNLQCTNVNV